MSNSPLVAYTKISPNRTSPRNHAIDRITVHCYVGQVTAEQGCNGSRFTTYDPENGASCNYVVGCDGSIGLCVEEKDRSWCSSSGANDHRAVTIETASDSTHPYAVTDAALQKLMDLCEDICRRYGKKKLLWFGDKDKTLAYAPEPGEMVMTVHRWFAAKACPGDYLYERHGMIAEEVTRRLNEEDQMLTYEQWMDYMRQYRQELRDNDSGEWSEKARQFVMDNKIFAGSGTAPDGTPNFMWEDLLTREQCAQVLYTFAQRFGLV